MCIGGGVSATSLIKSGCYFEGCYVHVGDGVVINHDCKFYSYKDKTSMIAIGDNVMIGMGVTFCTHTHEIGASERRAPIKTVTYPIFVGRGTWIGANSTILPGVRIGEGCIIAAGAVVTHDCIPNCLYAGVPAQMKKELSV